MRAMSQPACLATIGLLLSLATVAHAAREKTVGFVPDASCRSNALVTSVEDGFESNFSVKNVKVVRQDKEKASVVVQYFLVARRSEGQVVIQLDGKAYERGSGKLLAEENAESDSQPDDKIGGETAAKQAGARLAGKFSASLGDALSAKGKGRRVMLQLTLEGGAAAARAEVMDRLKRGLSEMAPRQKGSSETNLVLVLTTAERTKDLVEAVEQALQGALKPTWVVQSENSLILRLIKGPQ